MIKKVTLLFAACFVFACNVNAQYCLNDGSFNNAFNEWFTDGTQSSSYTIGDDGSIIVNVPKAGNDWDVELCNILHGNDGQVAGNKFTFECEVYWNSQSGYDTAVIHLLTGHIGWTGHDDYQWDADANTELITSNSGGFWGYVHNQSRLIPKNEWTHVSWGDELEIGGKEYIGIQINLTNTKGTNIGDFHFRNIKIEMGKNALYYADMKIGNLKYQLSNGTASVIGLVTDVTSIIIPEKVIVEGQEYQVTGINTSAFRNCSDLISVTIPNSVKSIGSSAFYDCSGLTSVTIGNSITSIGNSAFSGCAKLTSITIPNSVTSIGNSAFYGCSGLTSVTIGNSITSIGNSAFSGCAKLTSIIIPNSVTSIGNSAFYDCSGLTSVTIPNSVTYIGGSAFEKCDSIETLTYNTNAIGSEFCGKSLLKSLNIGNSVTSIGKDAFSGCVGLTSVSITDSVINIGDNAFKGCTSLTSVTIPKSVTTIGSDAFSGCNNLTLVTTDCDEIGRAYLYFLKDNIRYRVLDKNSVSLVSNSYSGEVVIPGVVVAGNTFNVTDIGSEVFKDRSDLTLVTIPNSVKSIGNSAFYDCSGLTSVTIPNSVTYIGRSAFEKCDSIETLTYNTNAIGSEFCGKSLLKSLNIGNSVTSIGKDAFSGCVGLTSVSITDSVTNIGDNAFKGCTSLTSVTIPKSVTTIGSNTFENCSGLTSIVIPNTVTSIGGSAFKDCVNLTIYCQAKVKHSGWDDKWNINNCPVVWGAQLANVNIAANNSAFGQVSGMGAYIDSTQVKILAIPNAGYIFVKWSDGNIENPRTIVATGDLEFTAVFEIANVNQGGNENQNNENQEI